MSLKKQGREFLFSIYYQQCTKVTKYLCVLVKRMYKDKQWHTGSNINKSFLNVRCTSIYITLYIRNAMP